VKLIRDGFDSVATFKTAELNPHRAWALTDGSPSTFVPGADPWQPRQKLPAAYQLNGAVYSFYADRLPVDSPALLFGRAGAIVMPPERSIDIDREIDFVMAEAMLARPK
jgi:N-acylneuraminate cytidylyltransferase